VSIRLNAAVACRTAIAMSIVVILCAGLATADDSAEPNGVGGSSEVGPAETGRDAADGAVLVSLRYTGSALKPRENDVSYTINGSGSCVYVTAGDSSTVWNHKVTSLPQGSQVDTLRMYFYDTSGSNSSAWFTVYDLYGNIVSEWPVSSSGSGGNSFNDSAQINHMIDYSIYSYLINWRPSVTGSTMQLCGFRIFYNDFLPIFSDGFESGGVSAWSMVQP